MPEQLAVLERAGDAEPGDGARGQASDIATTKANAALAAIDAADAVEHAGLAGPVGADQRQQLGRLYRQRDAIEHRQAAEVQAQLLDLELSHTISCCDGIA